MFQVNPLLKRQSRLQQTAFINIFSEKIRLDVSSESSARQRIHMKYQALFSLKDKSEKLKCRLLQFLFVTLRVKIHRSCTNGFPSHTCTKIPFHMMYFHLKHA